MVPVKDIIPGRKLPVTVFGAKQPQYQPLPAHVDKTREQVATFRYKLSWKERFQILFSGSLWIQTMTFGKPFQPIKPSVVKPEVNWWAGTPEAGDQQ